VRILSHESLAVDGEEAVLDAALAWTEYDEANRRQCLPSLLSAAVQWPLIKDENVLHKCDE